MNICKMPNGSLVSYRNKLYFVSDGLDDRIVTGTDGNWSFLKELKWKSFKVIYNPNLRK